MQGLFFRVDGADLETGEETYLVLQAANSDEAERIARRQGLLIATVRPATAADWGAAPIAGPPMRSGPETIVFEGINAEPVIDVGAGMTQPAMIDLAPADGVIVGRSIFDTADAPHASSFLSGEPMVEEVSALTSTVALTSAATLTSNAALTATASEPAAADLSLAANPGGEVITAMELSPVLAGDEPASPAPAPSATGIADAKIADPPAKPAQPARSAPNPAIAAATDREEGPVLSLSDDAPPRPAARLAPARPTPATPSAPPASPSAPLASQGAPPATAGAPLAGSRKPAATPPPSTNGPAAAAATRPAAGAKPVARPPATRPTGATPARPAAMPAAKGTVPPRPVPPSPAQPPGARPVRLTPPAVRRIPPANPNAIGRPAHTPPAAPAALEARLRPSAMEAPAADAPVGEPSPARPPAVEERPSAAAPASPPAAVKAPPVEAPSISDAVFFPPSDAPARGEFSSISSEPALGEMSHAVFDLGPAASDAQRVTGEVVGGSGIEQIVTKLAWDQTAQAVEHSTGSALERLALVSAEIQTPEPIFPEASQTPPTAQAAVTVEPAPASQPAVDTAPAVSAQESAALAQTLAAAAVSTPAIIARLPGSARAAQRRNGMLPLVYLLTPPALLAGGGGIALVIWALLKVMPADLTETVDKLDFRMQIMTYIVLGGMLMTLGFCLLLATLIAYLAGAVRALAD